MSEREKFDHLPTVADLELVAHRFQGAWIRAVAARATVDSAVQRGIPCGTEWDRACAAIKAVRGELLALLEFVPSSPDPEKQREADQESLMCALIALFPRGTVLRTELPDDGAEAA
jgi:hypothetical protein